MCKVPIHLLSSYLDRYSYWVSPHCSKSTKDQKELSQGKLLSKLNTCNELPSVK